MDLCNTIFYVFKELCGWCLQQWWFSLFGRTTYYLGLFGKFHRTLLANNWIGFNPVLVLEAKFGEMDSPLGTLLPPLFEDFIMIAFIYFGKCPLQPLFIPLFNALNSNSLHSFPHLNPLLHLSTYFSCSNFLSTPVQSRRLSLLHPAREIHVFPSSIPI